MTGGRRRAHEHEMWISAEWTAGTGAVNSKLGGGQKIRMFGGGGGGGGGG